MGTADGKGSPQIWNLGCRNGESLPQTSDSPAGPRIHPAVLLGVDRAALPLAKVWIVTLDFHRCHREIPSLALTQLGIAYLAQNQAIGRSWDYSWDDPAQFKAFVVLLSFLPLA